MNTHPPTVLPAPGAGEAALWRAAGANWRQLFGDFSRLGVSFEWHELETPRDLDWSTSFHPGSIELCLNLNGMAEVALGGEILHLQAGTAGFYRLDAEPLTAIRKSGPPHHFITVEMAPVFLMRVLGDGTRHLHPVVQAVIDQHPGSGLGSVTTLSPRQRELVTSLRHPPVLAGAQPLWYQAKAAELMGEFFFQSPTSVELFCHRQQRVSRDRVERVIARLKVDLVHPPTLEQLGREVGCSPYYLSRTFSKEVGQTLPQYLRQLRLERAAELLRSGRFNVTEAAMEVGYNSLSHFSQAFHQAYGCCPGLYPMATPTQRAARNGQG